MAARGFDTVYRSTIMKPIMPSIFSNGLGNPFLLEHLVSNFKYLRDPEFVRNFLHRKFGQESPVRITKKVAKDKKCQVLEGHFVSPFNDLVPHSLPDEATNVPFKLLLPLRPSAAAGTGGSSSEPPPQRRLPPVVIHLAGTGDYSVTLQEYHAKSLISHGVGSLLLTNPYYGLRRPRSQRNSSLNHLSDLFVMGGSLILECQLLIRWLHSQGYETVALHGISLGGYMASLAASMYNQPVALVPCLSWTTSSPCYLRGVLAGCMPWDVIRRQLADDRVFRERLWPAIRDASLPPRCRVPTDFSDPLRQQPEPAPAAPNGSSDSLRARIYSSVSSVGFDLFAASGRVADTLVQAIQTLRQSQLADDMEAKHKRQHQLASPTSPSLTPEEQEVREFVTCMLDYFTHLGNYERPVGPVFTLQALDDAYVLRDGVYPLTELWPGTECRVVKGGHVTTILKNCHYLGYNVDMRNIVLKSVGVKSGKAEKA